MGVAVGVVVCRVFQIVVFQDRVYSCPEYGHFVEGKGTAGPVLGTNESNLKWGFGSSESK